MNSKYTTIAGIAAGLIILVATYWVWNSGFSNKNEPQPTPEGISTIPPRCELSGQVVFIEEKIARLENAYFKYWDVQDNHNIIKWEADTDEKISIGPNMFAQLKLPEGSETVTIGFTEGKPQKKQYTLKASIEYPFWVDNQVKVLNKKCDGEMKVKIDY